MRKIKNYILEKEIGGGNFGKVYLGVNEKTNERVAVKIIPKESLKEKKKLQELLKSEVKIMGEVKNENVVRLYEFLESANNCYIVMEFCADGDFENYLKEKKKLTEENAVDFLKQLLNGFRGLFLFDLIIY